MNYEIHCPYCYEIVPYDAFKVEVIDEDNEIQIKAMCEYCRTNVVVSITGDLNIYTEENGVLY